EWASDIKNKKNENEMVLIDKIINEMTEEDIDEEARLAATDPNAFYEFIGENYINLISSSGVSIIAGSYEHMGKSFKEFGEQLRTLFKDSKSFLKKLKKYTDKAGNYMINKGDKWIKVGKAIGRTNILVGFSIGMYDNIENEDKTVGEAIAHNGLVIGVGAGATLLLVPVTTGAAAIIGVAVVATVATLTVDHFYKNNETFQEFVDSIGEAIQYGIENQVTTVPIMPPLWEAYDE